MPRRSQKIRKIGISMPQSLVSSIDSLADEVGLSRSEIITDVMEYVFSKPTIVDEIYPVEEEGENNGEGGGSY